MQLDVSDLIQSGGKKGDGSCDHVKFHISICTVTLLYREGGGLNMSAEVESEVGQMRLLSAVIGFYNIRLNKLKELAIPVYY